MRNSAIIALLIVGLDAMGLGLIMPVLPTGMSLCQQSRSLDTMVPCCRSMH